MFSNVITIAQFHASLRQQGSLTPQEKNVIHWTGAKANNSFGWGSFLGGAIAFAATRKVRYMFRFPITAGVSLIIGLCAADWSQNTCIEKILSLHGSRMQYELATIIMKNHPSNTSLMQLVSRHFYAENVFDDLRSDSAVIRWRYRNFSSENAEYNQHSHGSQSENGNSQHGHGSQAEYGDSERGHGSLADAQITSISDTNDQKDSVNSKQLTTSNSSNVMDDPLDQIFGRTMQVDLIQLPSGTGVPTKESARNRKRSHRRRRQRQHEVSADWDHVHSRRI